MSDHPLRPVTLVLTGIMAAQRALLRALLDAHALSRDQALTVLQAQLAGLPGAEGPKGLALRALIRELESPGAPLPEEEGVLN